MQLEIFYNMFADLMQPLFNGIAVKEYQLINQEENPDVQEKDLSIYLIPLEKPGLAPFYRKDQSQSYLLLGMDSQSTGVEREPFWFR